MQPRNHHVRPPREERAVLPEGPVGGLVVLPDS
jgi:hypothetical protein